MVNIWVVILFNFLLAAAIAVPIVLVYWWKQFKKIQKDIPEELQKEMIEFAAERDKEKEKYRKEYQKMDKGGKE